MVIRMSTIQNIKDFADANPREDLLIPMIEGGEFHLVVMGKGNTARDFKMLWDIVKIYCLCYDGNIKVHFAEGIAPVEGLQKMVRLHKLEDKVDFLGELDSQTQLSYYLGSHLALVLGEFGEDEADLLKARYFCLPVVRVGGSEETGMQEGTLQLAEDSMEAAASLWVLKNNHSYRKQLGKDSRREFEHIVR